MLEPARRGATYQDVLDAPPHMVAEVLDGELHLQRRPAKPHAETTSVLGMLLGPPFRLGRGGPGGWWIQDEPELHLGADILVPDLAGWRRIEMPELDLGQAFYTEPPAWVCEVVSPSTQGKDRVKKLPKYGAAGVRHAWLVDPLARTIEVFTLLDERWTLELAHEGDGELRVPPFDAVPIDLAEAWLPAG